MQRNYQSGPRRPQGGENRGEDRSNRYRRDEDEGRYSSAEDDRDYGSYTENDEGDSSVRAGSFDQGRTQYGRRDTEEQSGSTGRYAGYGNFGQGDYSRGRGGNTGQERYGQSGYGQGGYGQSGGNYRGGNFGQGRSGSQDYGYGSTSGGSSAWRGHGVEGDYGTGNEPYGEGQQYTSRRAGPGQGLHRGKGPKGYQRSDDRLKEMICERLREDPHIDASEVSVNVQAGTVTFDGTVDSRHTKNLIEDVAEQLGCEDVQNNLRVQRDPGQGRGETQGGRLAGSSTSAAASAGAGRTGASGSEEESKQRRSN